MYVKRSKGKKQNVNNNNKLLINVYTNNGLNN